MAKKPSPAMKAMKAMEAANAAKELIKAAKAPAPPMKAMKVGTRNQSKEIHKLYVAFRRTSLSGGETSFHVLYGTSFGFKP